MHAVKYIRENSAVVKFCFPSQCQPCVKTELGVARKTKKRGGRNETVREKRQNDGDTVERERGREGENVFLMFESVGNSLLKKSLTLLELSDGNICFLVIQFSFSFPFI